ncbi:hypothetical protein SCOR_30505 [Sulfidibacter corallicola]
MTTLETGMETGTLNISRLIIVGVPNFPLLIAQSSSEFNLDSASEAAA